MKSPPLLWLDIETTGLDPTQHLLLEVGIVRTNEELEEVGAVRGVVYHDVGDATSRMSSHVRDMHTENGLLEQVAASDAPLISVERELIMEVLSWGDPADCHRPLPMAGANVGSFDRQWLRRHMPRLHKLFSYRNFEVNTLYLTHGIRKPDSQKVAHRSLLDIRQDILNLKRFYKFTAFDREGFEKEAGA